MYIQFTSTLHFKSGSIRLAPQKSLSSALVPFNASSCLLLFSLLNSQTTHVWLATSELPQQLVNLIDIAPTPADHRCCVSAAHWETRILSLAVQVKDHRSRVSSQK